MAMKLRIIFLILFFLSIGKSHVCAETSLRATVDKVSIALNETLVYKIIATSLGDKLPAPKVPKFVNFAVISQAASSTIKWVKNKVNTTNEYVFILAPTKTGTLRIGPATILIQGETVSSEAFKIEVTKPRNKNQPSVDSDDGLPLPENQETAPEPELEPESKEPQATL